MQSRTERTITEHLPDRRRRAKRRLRKLLLLPVAMLASYGFLGGASPASAAGTGSVSGVVRTQAGTPVKDTIVSIAGLTARTSASGAYSIANVPFGQQFVQFSATCRSGAGFVSVDSAETLDLTFSNAFAFDRFGHVCRPFGSNFALDPLVSNVVPLVGDDKSLHVQLPFSALFYDNLKSSLDISTNGYVTFDGPSSLFANAPLPASAAPSDAIFAFWDDLVVDQLSAVKTGVRNFTPGDRIFKIRWENVRFSGDGTGARMNIELSIREDGVINVINVGADTTERERGDSATIGIKGPGAEADLIQQSFDSATLVNNLGVEYVENAPPTANAGTEVVQPITPRRAGAGAPALLLCGRRQSRSYTPWRFGEATVNGG